MSVHSKNLTDLSLSIWPPKSRLFLTAKSFYSRRRKTFLMQILQRIKLANVFGEKCFTDLKENSVLNPIQLIKLEKKNLRKKSFQSSFCPKLNPTYQVRKIFYHFTKISLIWVKVHHSLPHSYVLTLPSILKWSATKSIFQTVAIKPLGIYIN